MVRPDVCPLYALTRPTCTRCPSARLAGVVHVNPFASATQKTTPFLVRSSDQPCSLGPRPPFHMLGSTSVSLVGGASMRSQSASVNSLLERSMVAPDAQPPLAESA